MALRRMLFRLPLYLDRIGLHAPQRWLTRTLGVDWLVLETLGRRTGRPHAVVLDIVGRDAARDVYYVQPADGPRSSWVRNVTSNPDVGVRIGSRRLRARVRDATGVEGAEVVLRFLRAHPWYARAIVWFVGYVDRIDRPDAELRRDLAHTQVFAIEITSR